MPLFLRTREPMRQEKLILGGAITYRPRRHRFHSQRFPTKTHHKVAKPAVKAVVKPPAGASKPARRRGVPTQRGRRRRPPTQKQHRAPLPQRRQLQQHQHQQQHRVSQARRQKGTARHLSRKAIVKKRPQTLANTTTKAATTSAKQVLNQLAKSRQIQRAVKGVVADVNVPQTGKQLMNRVVSSAVNRSRKRPIEEMLEEEQQQQQSPAKRARFQSSGYSPIGYRGKKIQRGGTKQQLGGGNFLF